MEKTEKIILASKSPRRLEILRKHGIEPIVMPADTDESLPSDIGMEDAVKLLALRKARACYESLKARAEHSDCSGQSDGSERSGNSGQSEGSDLSEFKDSKIVGSDTIVFTDEILGKPKDRSDAYRMLSAISGTHHYVSTGVAVIDFNTGKEQVCSDVTLVHVAELSPDEINAYLDTDEPYDKAGSYAIQGIFGKYIKQIEGDYENVVGLPFHVLKEMI